MLPAIRKHARIAFRHLDPESREEPVQAVDLQRLLRRRPIGRVEQARSRLRQRPGPLRRGPSQGRSHDWRQPQLHDISSRYCQRQKGISVERLDKYNTEDECWEEILIPDNTCTPAELAASRIDFPAWLKTLKPVTARSPGSSLSAIAPKMPPANSTSARAASAN